MLPSNSLVNVSIEDQNISNKLEYSIDFNKKQISSSFIGGIDALKQNINSILNTERYNYEIYSFNHGVELQDLIGEDPLYVKADIHRRIEEALMQDERIISLDDPCISIDGDKLYYNCLVNSIYGSIEIDKEMKLSE